MKRLILTALLGLGLVTFATPASADAIAVGDWIRMLGSNGTLGGGAFTLDNLSTASSPDFLTFCIQRTQHIDYSQQFRIGSITNYADDSPVNDPISDATAWIYSNFRQGTLNGTYGADAIQAAIWILEDEWTTDVNNSAALRTAAMSAVSAGYRNGGVAVINLFYADGTQAQDQLALVPEPASMVLLGTGLLGLTRAMRRRGKKAA